MVENCTNNNASEIIMMWRKNCFEMFRVYHYDVYCIGSLKEKRKVWEEV